MHPDPNSLHGVPKEMSEKEQSLLGSNRKIDEDLQTVQIPGQWVRDVPGDDLHAVELLDVMLHASTLVYRRRFVCTHERMPDFIRWTVNTVQPSRNTAAQIPRSPMVFR